MLYIQQDHRLSEYNTKSLLTPLPFPPLPIPPLPPSSRTPTGSSLEIMASRQRSYRCGDLGPGPASSSESPDCPTPPGMLRVFPLSRWRCFICRQRFARMRDLRGHIRATHQRIQDLYDRGEFPFFRRCMTCHRQTRSKCDLDQLLCQLLFCSPGKC